MKTATKSSERTRKRVKFDTGNVERGGFEEIKRIG